MPRFGPLRVRTGVSPVIAPATASCAPGGRRVSVSTLGSTVSRTILIGHWEDLKGASKAVVDTA